MMSREKIGKNRLNRRTLLKAVGASAVVGSSFTVNAAGQKGSKIVDLRGSSEDPVLPKQAADAIEDKANVRAYEAINKKKGKSNNPSTPIVSNNSDSRFVAAYLEKFGENGKSVSFVGYSYSDERGDKSENIHKTADKVRAAMEDADTITDYDNPLIDNGNRVNSLTSTSAGPDSLQLLSLDDTSENPIQLMSSPDDGAYWSLSNRRTAAAETDNGRVTLDGNIYQFDMDEDGSTDSSSWAAIFTNRATPSSNNGFKSVDNFNIDQDWGDIIDVEDPGITETNPSGQIEGSTSTTYSLSLSGAGPSGEVSWDYSQPDVTMKENSGYSSAGWEYDVKSGYDTTLQVTTGSRCWIEEFDGTSCDYEDSQITSIGRAAAEAKFNSILGGKVEADTNMVVPICY